MRSRLRRMFTFANVCSALALFIALGSGTAYAANTIFSTDIVDGEVKAADLHGNSVNTNKIKDATIQAVDIADLTITGQQLAGDSVGSDKIVNESITSSDLATDSVNATEIADGSIDGGEIINDSLGSLDLAANSVGASEITDSSVGTADVANNSLTTADIKGTDSFGSISLGAGSVANGQCKGYDITVGGAVQNEVIIISARAALPTGMLIYGQQVPANGHGIMKVCNLTGGAMPALVDFPIRTITFG